MATVTGYTAARMKQIEDATVVGGHIDAFGNLILETRDGQYLLGGHVSGEAGEKGDKGDPGVVDQETLDDINGRIDDNTNKIDEFGVTPKAPTNVILLQNSAGFLEDGRVLTKLYVMWDVVVSDVNDDFIDIAEYEVWSRTEDTSATPFRRTPDSEMLIEGWPAGVRRYISVRARAVGSTVWSDLSAVELEVVPIFPPFSDIPPSMPILESNMGVVFPYWDGQLAEGALSDGFYNLVTETSIDAGVTWESVGTPATQPGQTATIRSQAGEEVSVRFRWRDTIGRISTPSEVATITTIGVGRIDITDEVMDAIDQAKADSAAALASLQDAVQSIVVEYALAASDTVPPTTGWSTNSPTRTPGSFIWTRTVITYANEDVETSAPAVLTGNAGTPGADGTPGRGMLNTLTTYQAGGSATTPPTGTWLSSPPSTTVGQYLWTRTVITWTDSTTSTAYSVAAHGATGPKGDDGVAGSDGADGKGVSSVTPYFLTVGSGTAAPAKPTTNPPGGSWSLTEPGYVSSTDLYRTELILYTDNSFAYTNVTKVSAYTAATQAVTVANLAEAKAQGMVKASVTDPGHQIGRIWVVLNSAGEMIGIKISNGSAWTSYMIVADQILVPSSVGTVSIADGAVTAAKVIIGDFTDIAAGSNFEGVHPWTLPAAFTVDSTRSKSGTKSLKINGSQTGTATLQGYTQVTPGDKWYCEFWAYRDADWNGTNGNSKIRFDDQSNTLIAASSFGATELPADVWTKITLEFAIPSTATALRVTVPQDATAGNIWLDDISIRRKFGGELLVDGAVTANKMNANEIWANEAWLDVLRAGVIEVDMVTANFGETLNLGSNSMIELIIDGQAENTANVAAAQETADNALSDASAANDAAADARGAADTVQENLNDTNAKLQNTTDEVDNLKTWFRVDAQGAHMGRTDSAFQTHMLPDRFAITDNGVETTYWKSGVMNVESAEVINIILSNHQMSPYDDGGTVIRAVGV